MRDGGAAQNRRQMKSQNGAPRNTAMKWNQTGPEKQKAPGALHLGLFEQE